MGTDRRGSGSADRGPHSADCRRTTCRRTPTGPTTAREAHEHRAFRLHAEIVFPYVSARMEQGNRRLALVILAGLKVRIEEVTSSAGQGQVVEIIGTAVRLREHVLYLERKVEDDLRGVAVFAAVRGAFGDGRVLRVHGWGGRTSRSVRATVASSSASMSASSSTRSSAVRDARWASNSCMRSYWAAVKYESG